MQDGFAAELLLSSKTMRALILAVIGSVLSAQGAPGDATTAPAETGASASSYLQLGNEQLRAGDARGAAISYASAVSLLEARGGSNSTALVAPLTSLGRALSAVDSTAAQSAFERAISISRRSSGLFNEDQIEALRSSATLYSIDGDFARALGALEYVVRVHERLYGPNDQRTALAMADVAQWHAATGDFLDARQRYRQALQIIESQAGPDSIALVEPLAGLADVYRREATGDTDYDASRTNDMAVQTRRQLLSVGADNYGSWRKLHPSGLRYLQRALQIAESNPTQIDPAVHRTVLLQTGDWLQLARQPANALPYYRRTFELKVANPMTPGESLQLPVPVYMSFPPAAARHRALPEDEIRVTFATIEFDVTPQGYVAAPRVVEADTSEPNQRAALKALADWIYRPRFENGVPVETRSLRYRMSFREQI